MFTNKKLALVCLGACLGVAAQADLVGSWSFQGNLNSDIGGVSLTGVDPTGSNNYSSTTLYGQSREVYNMVGTTGAGNNAGLQVTPGFLASGSDYSIEMLFSVSDSNGTGWRKVFDNSDLTQDQGLYVSSGGSVMDYFPHSGGTTVIDPNTYFNVIMTYNASTSLTSIYVNGALDSQVTASEAAIDDNTIPLSFFMDDSHTGFGEYSNASVGLIKVWNSELDATDVTNIESNPFTATPEPASMAVLGFGVVALISRRRKRAA